VRTFLAERQETLTLSRVGQADLHEEKLRLGGHCAVIVLVRHQVSP
jgi:hypothetical protein